MTSVLPAAAVTLDVTAPPYNAACNGSTNDATALQNAFNALPVQGGTLTIPAGRMCGVGSAGLQVTNKSYVILQGLGSGAGLKTLAAGPAFGTYGATMLTFSACFDCQILTITFDGNSVASNTLGIGLSARVLVKQSSFSGVNLTGAVVTYMNMDNRYEGNTISGLQGATRGLWIGNVTATELETRPLILNNTITSLGGSGIVTAGDGAQILNNVLTGTGAAGGSAIGLTCVGAARARNALVQGNVIVGWPYQGIQSDCTADADYTQHVQVIGNTIRQSVQNGIYIVRARNWIVKENRIEDCQGAGIVIDRAKDVVVAENQITDTRTGGSRTMTIGIYLVSQTVATPYDVERVLIEHNTVTNVTSHGALVTNTTPGKARQIQLVRNLLTDNSAWGLLAAEDTSGFVLQVVATQNTAARNTSGQVAVTTSDGVVN